MSYTCPVKLGRIATKLHVFCTKLEDRREGSPAHHAKVLLCQNKSRLALSLIKAGRCAEARHHLREALVHAKMARQKVRGAVYFR